MCVVAVTADKQEADEVVEHNLLEKRSRARRYACVDTAAVVMVMVMVRVIAVVIAVGR